jgi:hypothetical protein
MTTSATHGACYGIGPTIQSGPDASDDSCELLSQTIGGSTGLDVLAQGKGILKLVGSKFAQPAQGASNLKNERSNRNKREHVLYKKLTIVDDYLCDHGQQTINDHVCRVNGTEDALCN